jgi:hypothetical protein
MKTQWTKLNIVAVVFFTACVGLSLAPDIVYADDFGKIVHHIEATYHVHRNYRFLMGFAGFVTNVTHIAGVKNMKLAIFEDQRFDGTETDTSLDEIVNQASRSGWQPVVRSYSRHSGEHTYIYAQNDGKDLKLLVVNVEPNEAAVIQLKLNPDKLGQFIDENTRHSGRHGHEPMDEAMTFR